MKILVAVASRHGSTWEIGRVIGDVLVSQGLRADVAHMEDVDDLTEYDGFVIGSAVYAGRWLKPAARFMQKHASEFAGLPVWLFSSGPVGSPLRPHEAQSIDIRRITSVVRVREHRIFAGKLEHGHLKLTEKILTAAVHVRQGDFRNWREIRAWAAGIVQSLQHGAVRIMGEGADHGIPKEHAFNAHATPFGRHLRPVQRGG